MQEREIFTREEKQNLIEHCADDIYQYGQKYMQLKKVYDAYGYCMPVECWYNFRDAWFHYRKMYTRKERVSVLNEKYAMEEHLLRAWKDGIIYLLQEISEGLEFWYLNSLDSDVDSVPPEPEIEKIVDEVYRDIAQQNNEGECLNWSKVFVDGYQKIKLESRFQCCYYYYKKYISSAEMDKNLQKILHGLKDLVLEIRYSGTNIKRPNNPYEYMQKLLDLIADINSKLQKNGALYLIPISSIVAHNMVEYQNQKFDR